MLRHGSLFSGIGGFDLASRQMEWRNVLQCEIDPFCRKVLRHHFPSTHLHDDIRTLNGTQWKGKIDILTGGVPCQPASTAGRRRGTADDRWLWPEAFRIVREIEPAWIVFENVRGLASLEQGVVFESLCADLEALGYEIQPFCIPACAVGAPHRRERLWIIAHAAGLRCDSGCSQGERVQQNDEARGEVGAGNQSSGTAPYHPGKRLEGGKREGTQGVGDRPSSYDLDVTYPHHEGLEGHRRHDECAGEQSLGQRAWQEPWFEAAARLCCVDDELCGRLDLSTISQSKWRRESLKAYGNAIVPRVAYEIFKSIPNSHHA